MPTKKEFYGYSIEVLIKHADTLINVVLPHESRKTALAWLQATQIANPWTFGVFSLRLTKTSVEVVRGSTHRTRHTRDGIDPDTVANILQQLKAKCPIISCKVITWDKKPIRFS